MSLAALESYRARNRKAGVCLDCRAPLVPGRKRCQDCLERSAAYQRARRRARQRDGVCLNCPRLAIKAGRCARHWVRNAARSVAQSREDRRRKRAAGVCTSCGGPSGGRWHCLEHALARRDYLSRLRERKGIVVRRRRCRMTVQQMRARRAQRPQRRRAA